MPRTLLSVAAVAGLVSLAPAVQSQSLSESQCDLTASIVAKAQEMRLAGQSGDEALQVLTEAHADRSEAFRQQAIPVLVGQFVYAQPEAALDQDLGAFWKETCLSTDVSSVLGGG